MQSQKRTEEESLVPAPKRARVFDVGLIVDRDPSLTWTQYDNAWAAIAAFDAFVQKFVPEGGILDSIALNHFYSFVTSYPKEVGKIMHIIREILTPVDVAPTRGHCEKDKETDVRKAFLDFRARTFAVTDGAGVVRVLFLDVHYKEHADTLDPAPFRTLGTREGSLLARVVPILPDTEVTFKIINFTPGDIHAAFHYVNQDGTTTSEGVLVLRQNHEGLLRLGATIEPKIGETRSGWLMSFPTADDNRVAVALMYVTDEHAKLGEAYTLPSEQSTWTAAVSVGTAPTRLRHGLDLCNPQDWFKGV